VRLLVGEHLHAVLGAAQEQVSLAQRARAFERNETALLASGERFEQATCAQRRFAAAADQLHELHDELDLADAAGAELEVAGEILARDFRVDERLHLAQAGERAVVEIAAVDERPQRVEQARAGDAVAADDARLDPRVALPIAAFALVVLLHRGERQREPARVAERAQAQIDAVDVAVGIAIGEQGDEGLAHAREVGIRIERPRAVAAAVFVVGEDEVDVRREIEFAAAELTEAEHDETLHAALRVAHDAVALRDLALGAAQRVFDAGVGEHGGARERGGDAVVAVDVAPDQPQRFAQAERTQQAAQRVRIADVVEDAGARVGVTRVGHQTQRVGAKQHGIAQETAIREIAGEQHAAQAVVDAGIVVERHGGRAASRFHARKAFGDEGGERRRPARGIGHAAIVAGAVAERQLTTSVKIAAR
jgi:hypothetical protein